MRIRVGNREIDTPSLGESLRDGLFTYQSTAMAKKDQKEMSQLRKVQQRSLEARTGLEEIRLDVLNRVRGEGATPLDLKIFERLFSGESGGRRNSFADAYNAYWEAQNQQSGDRPAKTKDEDGFVDTRGGSPEIASEADRKAAVRDEASRQAAAADSRSPVRVMSDSPFAMLGQAVAGALSIPLKEGPGALTGQALAGRGRANAAMLEGSGEDKQAPESKNKPRKPTAADHAGPSSTYLRRPENWAGHLLEQVQSDEDGPDNPLSLYDYQPEAMLRRLRAALNQSAAQEDQPAAQEDEADRKTLYDYLP